MALAHWPHQVDRLREPMRDVVHALRHPDWYDNLGLRELRKVLELVEVRAAGGSPPNTLKQIRASAFEAVDDDQEIFCVGFFGEDDE